MTSLSPTSLSNPVSLDVLVTGRFGAGTYGRVWKYQLWTPDNPDDPWDIPYSALCSKQEHGLYAGQRATVTGTRTVSPPSGGARLIIDEVKNQQRIFDIGDAVSLVMPRRSRSLTGTFAAAFKAAINGRDVELQIPIVMHGAVVEDLIAEPKAAITSILEQSSGRGYLVYARYVTS